MFSTKNEDINRYRDDPTVFESVKRLGLFTVSPVVAPIEWIDPQAQFELRKFDRYLDLHMPGEIDTAAGMSLLPDARKSFELIADYVLIHNLPVKYVVGVTFEKLGLAAKLFSFSTFVLPLSQGVYRYFEEEYKQNHPRGLQGKPMGDVIVLYQTTAEFLDRFGS